MSEFSVSYHVRCDDERDLSKALRAAKFGGIAFGPANGWVTFVPYANSPAYLQSQGPHFAQRLSKVTGRLVVQYCYAEDHGWMFAVARGETPLMQFECWWDPAPTVQRHEFDLNALRPIASPEQLEPLLKPFDHEEAISARPAYRFAELLGLPAYRWLSPELAQDHTDDLLGLGGRKLGRKPVSAGERIRLPPNRQIDVPRPLLSAKETWELIRPFMARYEPPWALTLLSTHGMLQPDGYGVWMGRWRRGDSGDTATVVLREGKLSFSAHSAPASMTGYLNGPVLLPAAWLDSPEIAAIVTRLAKPDGLVRPTLGLLSLRSFRDVPCAWYAMFSSDGASTSEFASWTVSLDPASGEVRTEQLARRNGHMIVPALQRRAGGEWENVPVSD